MKRLLNLQKESDRMKTTKHYIVNGSDETEHSRATFGILVLDKDKDFDVEAKNILEQITLIKEEAFNKNLYSSDTRIVIVECLPSQVKQQTAKMITLRWGGNIACITTAGEYNPENRRKWHKKFWADLHC